MPTSSDRSSQGQQSFAKDVLPSFTFWYNATVLEVTDGDTATFEIDLGFQIRFKSEKIRFYGINAYELTDKDPQKRQLAQLGKQYVIDAIGKNDGGQLEHKVIINTFKDKLDKYGRFLATVYYYDPETKEWKNLNAELLEKGLAVPLSY